LKGLAVELLDAALGVPEDERTERTKVDEEAVELYKKLAVRTAEAREKLFPGAPFSPNVPHALPLEAYTGIFRNVGYGPLTLVVGKDEDGIECLRIDLVDRTWKTKMIVSHVKAERWL
ncbi:hypothetical protein LTR53_019676, partial [Teratosphaeriaceae sp. CCFEE 6253]